MNFFLNDIKFVNTFKRCKNVKMPQQYVIVYSGVFKDVHSEIFGKIWVRLKVLEWLWLIFFLFNKGDAEYILIKRSKLIIF